MLHKRIYSPPRQLALAAPGVFLLGVSVTLMSRYLFYIYHPEFFERGVPSISRTAAFPPSSYLFTIGITLTSVLIFISWYFVFHMNTVRIQGRSHTKRAVLYNSLAYAFGLISGSFLALLALITSEMDGPSHEWFSVAFFATQVAAFTFDGLMWRELRRLGIVSQGSRTYLHGRNKALLLLLILAVASALLLFYVSDLLKLLEDRHLSKLLFVTTEYATSILCFAYSAAYYPEIRDHLDHRHATL